MKRNKFVTPPIMFLIGCVGYGLLEVIWRGETHPSMLLAGGISFCSLAVISKRMKDMHFLYKCIIGSVAITAIELIFGCIFNIWLRMNVWDYSYIPLNFDGQICFLYSVIWAILCTGAIPFSEILYNKLKVSLSQTQKPEYISKIKLT